MDWRPIETAPGLMDLWPFKADGDHIGDWVVVACWNRGEWAVTVARYAFGQWEQPGGGLLSDGGEFIGHPSWWLPVRPPSAEPPDPHEERPAWPERAAAPQNAKVSVFVNSRPK